MEITDTMIDKLAGLSRLHFGDGEKLALKKDFAKMVDFVDKLNELDTKGVKPLLHITDSTNVLRKDAPLQGCSRENALRNAPIKSDEFFKVPKVINKQ